MKKLRYCHLLLLPIRCRLVDRVISHLMYIYMYIFNGLAPWRNFATCKIHFASKSCVLLYWQRYCTALKQRASAKLCDMVQGMELRRNFRRGRHLHLAGRPSRWASAHILVQYKFLRQKLARKNVSEMIILCKTSTQSTSYAKILRMKATSDWKSPTVVRSRQASRCWYCSDSEASFVGLYARWSLTNSCSLCFAWQLIRARRAF